MHSYVRVHVCLRYLGGRETFTVNKVDFDKDLIRNDYRELEVHRISLFGSSYTHHSDTSTYSPLNLHFPSFVTFYLRSADGDKKVDKQSDQFLRSFCLS